MIGEQQQFPPEDIAAARNDAGLQREHDAGQGKERYLQQAHKCPTCGTPPEFLEWFYFNSPDWTWRNLCGRAGWMTYCEWCENQVDFFLEIMN